MSGIELTSYWMFFAVALLTSFAAGALTMHVWLWRRITKWRG